MDQLKSVWTTLERADALCTPFSSWVWADAWWREFGLNNGKLRILIVKNGKEVVGICPLYRQTIQHFHILPVTTLALLGAVPGIQSTHPGVIAHPRFRKLCETAVLEHLPKLKGWDTLDFDGIAVDSSFAVLARKRLKRPPGVVAEMATKEISQECLLCGWNDYRAVGDGQRALELTRLRKTLTTVGSTTGPVQGLCSEPGPRVSTGPANVACELSICSTRHDLNESLDVFYSLSQQSAENVKLLKSNFAAQERFFKRIVPDFFVADMLWQLTLKVDEQIVGVQHYFIWRGDLLLFQGAYAPELERFDVARYMLAYAIKRGMAQASERVRIHSLPAEFAHPFVTEPVSLSHMRFTPSVSYRVVEKMLKTLNKYR